MAEALKTFKEGEDILASETNANNQFLLSKLSDNAMQVQSYVEGEVASIKSNVSSVQATLQNNIDELDAKKPIYIIECSENGNRGLVLYSNGFCEQWGRANGRTTVVFTKPFKNTQYNVQLTRSDGSTNLNENPHAHSLSTTSFYIGGEMAYSGVHWRATGFAEMVGV